MGEIALTDTARYDLETVQNLTAFAYLTQHQKAVLAVMVDSMQSDLIQTDAQIGELANVSERTVWNCRHNAHFLTCLSEATRKFTQSKTAKYIKYLEKTAEKGSVKAVDLLLRYTGDYIPKQQIESKSQNLNLNANIKPGEAISEFIALLCDKGWNRDRIHAEIDRVYDDLKEQGRVI